MFRQRRLNRSRERGFLLAAAIAICAVMMLVALMVGQKNQRLLGVARDTETDALQAEGAAYAFALVRGVLQTQDPLQAPAVGLTCPLALNQAFTPFGVPSSEASFSGNLTYDGLSLPGQDGYAGTNAATGSEPAPGQSPVMIPTGHSAAVLNGTIPGQHRSSRYLTIYSSNYPYGLVAGQGALKVKSVRSVNAYDNNSSDNRLSGLMAAVQAQGPITIQDGLNGRAISQSSITAGGTGGILYPNSSTPVQIPGDFAAGMQNFKVAAMSGGLAMTLNALLGGNPTVTLPASLRIPGETQHLTCNVVLGQDLILENNSVLVIEGNLAVGRNICLGQNSTLVVRGSTHANHLSVTYSLAGTGDISIRSAFYGQGDIHLGGMSQVSVLGWIPAAANAALEPYTGAPVNGGSSTDDVAGVLVLSDGHLTFDSATKVSGLLCAKGLTIQGSAQLVGAAWSTADIDAANTDYRYFPYFTHALGHTASIGNQVLTANEQHPVAFGKLP